MLRRPPSSDPYFTEVVSILNAELTRREPEILGVSDDGTTFTVRFRAPLSCGWVQAHVQSTAAGEGGISAYDDTNYTSTTLVDCRADRLQDVTVTLVAAVQNIVYLIPVQYDAAGTKVLYDGEGGRPDNMAWANTIGVYAGAGLVVAHVSKSTSYGMTAVDFIVTVTAACTITLPAAAGHEGRQYKIHADANNVIVDDIEGSNFTLMLGETLDVYSNGTEWFA
ncbi:MAG TPA: hypothetical protein VMY42_22550 [Thermoguttaceae bacterium]|nr:hypothetical protein [Thermoguttaceae bacterium]